MARARYPNRDKAFEIYKEHNGTITNRAIAEILDVPEKTIGSWKSKSKDNWNEKLNGVLRKKRLEENVAHLLAIFMRKATEVTRTLLLRNETLMQ